MQITIIDRLALWLPALGGLVPASMTYHNSLTVLGFPFWQAALLGLVVEVIGFVAIATALDLLDLYGLKSQQTWIAIIGTLVYLFVVVAINALLDEGGMLEKITKGLMASFGLLGGMMLALRNQMGKARSAMADGQRRADEALASERERQARIEAEEREFERKLKEERLRQNHEIKLQKILQKGAETFSELSEPAGKVSGTFGKWKDWRKLPESEKKVISGLERPEEVSELYGVSEKTGGNWLANAKKEIAEVV